MLFSSVEFLFRFLPVFMLLYLIVPARYRNFVLLAGSLVFYGVGEPYFVLLLIFSVVVNYGISKYMFWEPAAPIQNRVQRRVKRRRAALIISLVFDFSLLFLFKYWDFAVGTVNQLAGSELIPVLALTLPLGISFYTFQMVSYQVDCYRGVIEEPPGFVPFAAYVSMFPQLIAGPIVRYDEVADRMRSRRMRIRNLENGLKLFTLGLGLKVLLANQIGTLWNTIMTAGAGNLHPGVAWLGAVAYSFQIYFDFWGYSVMAMGLGKMLGFRIPQNFDSPYASRSISEFWRRWHITLGRWFREYVYFPLGGSRVSRPRMVANLFVVWLLTGMWHGANWTFIAWGLMYFVILTFEKLTGLGRKECWWGHIYTMVLVIIGWVIFRSTGMGNAFLYIKAMFGIGAKGIIDKAVWAYIAQNWIYFVFAILGCAPIMPWIDDQFRKSRLWQVVYTAGIVVCLIVSVSFICNNAYNPFIYFNF